MMHAMARNDKKRYLALVKARKRIKELEAALAERGRRSEP
jgi:hypothetical protein